MTRLLVCLATVTLLAVPGVASSAVAGETIEQIKTRRTLRCGVSDGMPGFSTQTPPGAGRGRRRLLPRGSGGGARRRREGDLRPAARLGALPGVAPGSIDLLVRNTTWTLSREAGLEERLRGNLLLRRAGIHGPGPSKVDGRGAVSRAPPSALRKGTTQRGQPRRLLRGARVRSHAARLRLHGRGRRGVLRRPLRGLQLRTRRTLAASRLRCTGRT